MLKTILFDHDDLDAAGCRILFTIAHHHMKYGKDYIIVNCSNTLVDESVNETINRDDVDENTIIYITDICPSREVLEHVAEKFKTVKIFDHHRTNFFATWVVPDAVIVPENNLGVLESGTSLLFKHFVQVANNDPLDPRATYFLESTTPDEHTANFKFISNLTEHIRSYDTYDWKNTNNITAKKLQTLFFMLGMERFCKRYVNKIIETNIPDSETDNMIEVNDSDFIDARMENEQRVIDSIGPDDVYDVSIKGLKAAFILSSAGANISELSSQFLTKYPEYDMFIGFSFIRGGEYSFRCKRDDIDTGGYIAEPIGGGGHPKASGAPLPEEVRNEIISILMRNIDIDFKFL